MIMNPHTDRKAIAAAMLLFLLLLTSCAVSSVPDAADSGQNRVSDIEPYQDVTLLVSDYSLLNEDAQTLKATLKKNLTGYCGLAEARADQLIQNGKFELRYIEIGDEQLDGSLKCLYHASAMITVWKSEGYFAVCSTENANFIPSIVPNQAISLEDRGTAWSDVEEGSLKPKTRSELITIVIGKTIAVQTHGAADPVSHTYLKRISVAYDPYPVNENGETYGSSAQADSIESEPDLIAAKGIDGTEGYVKKSDFNGEMPKTTEEAITRNNQGLKRVPLYRSDGQTVIGTFEISGSETVEYTENDI